MLALRRGARPLDGNGRLVIYPGSGAETFKMAYNPTSTAAGLRTADGGPRGPSQGPRGRHRGGEPLPGPCCARGPN